MICDHGIQWNNLMFASKSASVAGSASRDHCALLMDEMIITNGIVYSVSQQKVYGLSELSGHNIKTEIYHDFYKMDSNGQTKEDLSKVSYFNDTAEKMEGYKATGLTQVKTKKHFISM
jgi:hypothetical protein